MKRNERKPRMHQWRLLKLHTFVLTSALVCRNLLKHFFVTIFSSKNFDYSSTRSLVRITRGQYDCSSVLYATFLHTKRSLKNWLFQSTNIILKAGANEKNWILTGFTTKNSSFTFWHFMLIHGQLEYRTTELYWPTQEREHIKWSVWRPPCIYNY